MKRAVISDEYLASWHGRVVIIISAVEDVALVLPDPPLEDYGGMPISFWIERRFLKPLRRADRRFR